MDQLGNLILELGDVIQGWFEGLVELVQYGSEG
jgi:hypothetical protein